MALIFIAIWLFFGALGSFCFYKHVGHMHKTCWQLLERDEVYVPSLYGILFIMFLAGPSGLLGSLMAILINESV